MPKNNRNKHKINNAQEQTSKIQINEEELTNQCLAVYQLLKDRTSKLRQMNINELCYILSTKWLKQWKQYVGYEYLVGQQQEQSNKNKKQKDKRFGKRHPGKINIDIYATKQETNQFYTIPKELQDYQYLSQIINEKKTKDDDYIAITPTIWEQLLKYYQGISIRRPINKIKNTFYYDGALINFDVIFANVDSQDIEDQIKNVQKKNYTSIFKSDKIIASNFWTFDALQHFLSEYCGIVYNYSKIRIWKVQSYIATNPINQELVKALKDRTLSIKARLLEKERYKDVLVQDFLKSNYTLIVEMGKILKPSPKEDKELFGYCEECVEKKKLLISCLCGQIYYCSDKCRIEDQLFHSYTCKIAYDSQDDEEFQKKIDKKMPLAGLNNLANTCYMNSVLQVLISIDQIRSFFTTNQYLQFLDEKETQQNNCRFLRKFSKTLKNLQGQDSYTPWALKSQIDYNLPPFKGDKQHDANDFFINFVNCLNDHLTKDNNKAYNKIIEPFIGQFYSKVLCPHCNVKSQNYQIFLQISLPLKAKPSQKSFNYTVVQSFVDVKKGKCTAGATWAQIKQSVDASKSIIYLGKQCAISQRINQDQDEPQKYLRNSKIDIFFYKNIQVNEEEILFIFGLITQKMICGSKMKFPYGVPILIPIRDKQLTLGTFWLQIIQYFYYANQEIVKQAQETKLSYLSQIQNQIKEDDKNKQKKEETQLGQQKQSIQCQKIVKQFNSNIKMFAQRIGIQVFVVDLKKNRNTCRFCNKKCNGCFLPKDFDKAFEDFFEDKYSEVRFQVFLKQPIEINYNQKDLLVVGDPTIHDCIQLFSQPQQLDEENAWYCSNCDSMALALKQLHIKSYPETLIIHLNRFKTVNGKKMKNSDPILYNEIECFEGKNYKLIGAVIHEGNMQAGHYWCIGLREDKYYVFNDSKVTYIQKIFNKNAYILIYQKF